MERDEAAQKSALIRLIRELHRGRKAEAIIEAFEASLTAHEPGERGNILEYWIDFYRLRRYQRDRRRRRASYRERISPCSACGYPSSQRHHLWDVATHGENRVTIQLCANCHELQHLMYNALVKDSEHSRRIALHIARSGKISAETLRRLIGWCAATIRYEADQGWVPEWRADWDWIGRTFGEILAQTGKSDGAEQADAERK
jgi:ribosomal protein L37E